VQVSPLPSPWQSLLLLRRIRITTWERRWPALSVAITFCGPPLRFPTDGDGQSPTWYTLNFCESCSDISSSLHSDDPESIRTVSFLSQLLHSNQTSVLNKRFHLALASSQISPPQLYHGMLRGVCVCVFDETCFVVLSMRSSTTSP
jgi:hypothetical protein